MPVNRYKAMVELGTLGKDAAVAVPLLSTLINDQYEPHSSRLAMIDTLQKIGAAAKTAIPALTQVMSLTKSDLQQVDGKAFFLSLAAERAILFIESKPEEQPYRDLLVVRPLIARFVR